MDLLCYLWIMNELYDDDWLQARWLISWGRYLPYNPDLKERARDLRKNMTSSEKKLWYHYLNNLLIPLNKGEVFLKENQGDFTQRKIKVLRQKIIDNYIVDFYIPEIKLSIELDWEVHENQKEYDAIRTEILTWYGVQEIRILNYRIDKHFAEVCKKLEFIVYELISKKAAEKLNIVN